MVKLTSAREIRTYGPRLSKDRAEYVNAGLYVFGAAVLVCGLAATGFSTEPRSGLVLILISLCVFIVVNVHDLVAHLAGIDYRLGLMANDAQLALVEFAVPLVQIAGSVVFFLGILFLLLQAEIEYGYYRVEKHAMDMLIAGPALWVLGSIHNSCQIYERADGLVQILQQSVHIPFLIGSLLFLLASVLNSYQQAGLNHHGLNLLGETWVWLGVSGGLSFFIGGLMNVVKVFNMLQILGIRLEKLRGGAQERLFQEREGQLPLINEEQRRLRQADEAAAVRSAEQPRLRQADEATARSAGVEPPPAPTPYKDVLVGRS